MPRYFGYVESKDSKVSRTTRYNENNNHIQRNEMMNIHENSTDDTDVEMQNESSMHQSANISSEVSIGSSYLFCSRDDNEVHNSNDTQNTYPLFNTELRSVYAEEKIDFSSLNSTHFYGLEEFGDDNFQDKWMQDICHEFYSDGESDSEEEDSFFDCSSVFDRPASEDDSISHLEKLLKNDDMDDTIKADVVGIHCNAKHFIAERVSNTTEKTYNDCCSHGKVKLSDDADFPDALKSLFTSEHALSSQFFQCIRVYNNLFAFASFNANTINFSERRPGPYCFKIQGQIYYKINTAIHPEGADKPSYGQLFIYDPNEAVQHRQAFNNELNYDIILLIENIMRRYNIFAKSYEMMGEELKKVSSNSSEELNLLFSLKKDLDKRRYNPQRTNEVAAIFSTSADGEIPDAYVVIRNKSTKQLQKVSTMDPNVEPWIYPLFYPTGERGWHRDIMQTNMEKRVSRGAYIKYKIAIRNNVFNPYIHGRRLFQQFLVDSYVKIEKDRIEYCKSHQLELRIASYKGLMDHLNKRSNNDNLRIGPVEATWRILSKPLHDKSHVIVRLPVHLPDCQNIIIRSDPEEGNIENALNKVSMLVDYFALNARDPEARQYSYSEIPEHYRFNIEKIDGIDESKWQKRVKHIKSIGRMYTVNPSQIELFHLRILLLHIKGATSFDDLKTVNGVVHDTFSAACLAHGFIEDDEEWTRAMTEASTFMMPKQLRRLYVRILIHCNPIHPDKLWNDFKNAMSEDFLKHYDNNVSYAKAINDIHSILQMEGKNMNDFPQLHMLAQAYPYQPDEQNINDQCAQYSTIGQDRLNNLNDQQKLICDKIISQVLNGSATDSDDNCFFINGVGGSGKTYLYETLWYILKGHKKNIVTMAFTGIAATLLPHESCIAAADADIVDDMYGTFFRSKQYRQAINCAILSPRNVDVNEINEGVVNLLDEATEKIYTSVDSTENCDNSGFNDILPPEYLNSLNPPSLPPYTLKMIVGYVIQTVNNSWRCKGLPYHKVVISNASGKEIQLIAWNNYTDKISTLEIGQNGMIMQLHNFKIKAVNPAFNSTGNEYQIEVDERTFIREVTDCPTVEEKKSLPFTEFHDVQSSTDTGIAINVVGIIKRVGDIKEFQSKSSAKSLKKRDVILMDENKNTCVVTMWNDDAVDWKYVPRDIITITGAGINEFCGFYSVKLYRTSVIIKDAAYAKSVMFKGLLDELMPQL
uniref:ATP-dependent DNA helicase n=2 Tax=Trichogramma kaykai TaxID=54128 RepID=A0ABD2WBL0_9HYME